MYDHDREFVVSVKSILKAEYRQVLDVDQRTKPFHPRFPLVFDPVVEYKLDLRRASCGQGARFICASLIRKGANFSSTAELQTCIPGPSCKDGVVVNALEISMDRSIEVEAGILNTFRINVSIMYDMNLTSDVTGNDQWQLMIWSRGLHDDYNDSSSRLSLSEQALTQSQADQSLISGEEFRFTNVEYTLDMRNITCEQTDMICVRFRRGHNGTYELLSKPNASVRTKCVEAPNCQEDTEIFVTELYTNTSRPCRENERDCDVIMDTNMTPSSDQPSTTTGRMSTTSTMSLSTVAVVPPRTTVSQGIVTSPTFYQWLETVIEIDVAQQGRVDQSAESISSELADWTDEIDDVSKEELRMTGRVLEQISHIEEVSEEVASNVVDAVDRIISIESSSSSSTSMRDPDNTASSSALIVQSMERLLTHVKLPKNTSSNFSTSGANLAMAAFNLVADEGNEDLFFVDDVLQINIREEVDDENGSVGNRKVVFEKVRKTNEGVDDADVSVEVETGKLLNSAIDSTSNLRIDLIVYHNDTLFKSAASTSAGGSHGNPSSSDGSRKGCSIESKVLSVTIRRDGEEMKRLAAPINMTFKLQKTNPSYTPTCTYWDYDLNDGEGDWSTLGCDLVDENDVQAVCSCDHLTNFAVLMAPSYGCHPYALDVISQIGCVISTLGLVLTIITYIMFGKQMGQTPRLIMIQWCVSLLLLYIVFVIGIDQTQSPTACTAVAALLHYFTLSSVLWMGVEGVNLYILLVRVMDVPRTRRFMPVACLVAWGIPIGFVLIGLFQIGPDQYREESFCFLSRGPHFIYALLFPLAAVLLLNIVCYILVMKTLTCSRMKIRVTKIEKGKLHDLATRLQQALAIGLLTGLTWLFGFFAIGRMSAVFTWLFCICNSLQGLCVFLLFCVFRPELRRAWRKQLCPSSIRPKRRSAAKSSELDNIRSRSTSLRDTYNRSTSGGTTYKPTGTYREYSSSTSFNRTLSG
nr:adhesion G-protein coupled receptor G2-like [Lytechinus pictus]